MRLHVFFPLIQIDWLSDMSAILLIVDWTEQFFLCMFLYILNRMHNISISSPLKRSPPSVTVIDCVGLVRRVFPVYVGTFIFYSFSTTLKVNFVLKFKVIYDWSVKNVYDVGNGFKLSNTDENFFADFTIFLLHINPSPNNNSSGLGVAPGSSSADKMSVEVSNLDAVPHGSLIIGPRIPRRTVYFPTPHTLQPTITNDCVTREII